MWSGIRLFFLIILISGVSFGKGLFKPRTGEVQIEWEVIKDAVKYEIEIISQDGKFTKRYHSSTNAFKFPLVSNIYLFRGRTVNGENLTSAWSGWRDLNVPFEPVPIKFEVKSKEDTAEVKWEPVKMAKKYKIVARERKKNILKEFVVSGNKLKTRLPAGKFQFSVQAVSDDGRETAAIESPVPVKLYIEKENPPEATFEAGDIAIKQVEGKTYNCALSYAPFLEDTWQRVEVDSCKIKNVTTPLKPGRYRANVVSTSEDRGDSDPQQVEFIVKPKDL
jgi:hypothetical protein